MSKHQDYHNHCRYPNHTNGFIDMNGVPYLLGEYLDKEGFMQIDRSAIKSDIFVDTSDAMRAVVDISIDDIGQRSDGYLNILGNYTKHKNLLKMISMYKDEFSHQLPVLRRGIIVRINYQLENCRTKQVIRKMNEDIPITERYCFVDINPRDIDDNGIISNFERSCISTINEFTHGRDKMILRITNVELFYEWVKNCIKGPHIKQSTVYPDRPDGRFYGQMGPYYYHDQFQHEQFIGSIDGYKCPKPEPVIPPSWHDFNRFYHFDDNNTNIILHDQEIYDPNMPTGLLPCGRCRINRSFIINPGHRLMFKFCIWKNDLTVVSNTQSISDALKVPMQYPPHHHHDHHHDNHHHHNGDIKDLIRKVMNESRREDMKQNELIKELLDEVEYLKENKDHNDHNCGHNDNHHHHHHDSCLDKRLDEIEDLLHQLIEDDEPGDCECDHESITAEDIRNMIDEIKNEENKN